MQKSSEVEVLLITSTETVGLLGTFTQLLILQHPSDLAEVIIRKNANLSTSSMGYSSWRLLYRVTVASSAASAILNLSERRVDAVKSGSLRCANEFK